MIQSELSLGGELKIVGELAETEAEIVIILREIYKKEKEIHGADIAKAMLFNLGVRAITAAGDTIE